MSTKQSYSSDEVIDPITGKSVPIKDMPEHMRIQLLDPKWAEERKKFQEKQKDSNLVSGDMIASNISRFSNQAFGNIVSISVSLKNLTC
jgi:splicing factor 3A subunit 1